MAQTFPDESQPHPRARDRAPRGRFALKKRATRNGDRGERLTLGEEELDEVGAVLTGGTGDEGDLALAVASHGVHLAGLVLGGLAEDLDGRADGDGHCIGCV